MPLREPLGPSKPTISPAHTSRSISTSASHGLQASGEVGRFADRCLLSRLARSDRFAYNHKARRYANANPRRLAQRRGFITRSDNRKRGTDSPLSVVLVRLRIAEVDQHAVTNVTGNKAVEARDCCGDTGLIAADQRTQILGIEVCLQCRRADQVTEHNRQLAALAGASG